MANKITGTYEKKGRNTFGPYLRQLRLLQQLSAEEVSARIELQNERHPINVSANHLHKVERQEKPLSDTLLLAYLEAIETNLQKFAEYYGENV